MNVLPLGHADAGCADGGHLELAGDDCGAGQAILSRSRGLRPGVDVSQAHSPLGKLAA